MRTRHRVLVGDSRQLPVADASVHLVVTSPPYPMIGMWDEVFAALAPDAGEALAQGDAAGAFEAQHRVLDAVWAEAARVLVPGGFLCVNIGDATRSIEGRFALWPNHSRVQVALLRLGFTLLPDILWHKPTNAPNKFMGSGMLPAGAYVTYEHEYVLIARKGGARRIDRELRSESAYFWEERNRWFSDLWTDLPGSRQKLDEARARSAAFPVELPFRLIAMYSLRGDTVLDPFTGTGTTQAAALMLGRDSVGVEREATLRERVVTALQAAVPAGRARAEARLREHAATMAERTQAGKAPKHRSAIYGFPVVTRQEAKLQLWAPVGLQDDGEALVAEHAPAALPALTA